jgi:hypothetical protein
MQYFLKDHGLLEVGALPSAFLLPTSGQMKSKISTAKSVSAHQITKDCNRHIYRRVNLKSHNTPNY